jgi:uncharacterized protein (DUF1778 family)
MSKSEQLQIRLTREQKSELKRRARNAGLDVSAFVLSRVLPSAEARFAGIVVGLAEGHDHRFVLAELSDLLASLTSPQLASAVANVPAEFWSLDSLLRNYVAAMVEQTCAGAGVALPVWAARVEPLVEPYFATTLRSLRLHLLAASPVAFRRRNIFVDAGVGARV